MKVYLISKRTLIYIAAAAVVLIAAVMIAVFSSANESSSRDGTNTEKERHSEYVRDGSDPGSSSNSNGTDSKTASTGVVDEYEIEVFAGLMKELPVYSVNRSDRKIALTIDAAWEDDKTPFILSTLEKYGIKATFFLCGFWVKDYPEMVKAIADAGHEIGNHSMTHPHMSRLSSDAIVSELNAFESIIEPIIGKKTRLFRAPFGEYNDNVINTVRKNGYEPVQWNIDTVDWKSERSAQTILDTVLPKLSDGSIILSHNNGYKIEQYLPTLIESALAQGYQFVTVSELLLSGNTVIDVNGVQKQLN